MTQRQAVFVGCRLIAVYLVAEAAVVIGSSLFSLGMLTNMMSGPAGGMMPPPAAFAPLLQSLAMQAIVRGGVAILLWAAAPRISRMAANPVDGDDGWHGD